MNNNELSIEVRKVIPIPITEDQEKIFRSEKD